MPRLASLLFAFALLSQSSPSDAEPLEDADTATVRFESTGREVTVNLRDQGRCTTPCELELEPGLHSARVDGLDRKVHVGPGGLVVIRPTRWRLMGLGIASVAAGSVGLTFAGHWASPLDGRQRVFAALGGLAMTALAIPLITSASARVYDGHKALMRRRESVPERLLLSAGIGHAGLEADPNALRVTGSLGYRLGHSRFGFRATGQLGLSEARDLEFAVGPHVHLARLPIISVSAGVRGGLAWRRPTVDGKLQIEPGLSAQRGALVELASELRVELPSRVQPVINLSYGAAKFDDWEDRFVVGIGAVVSL